jgi:putative endonuclease
MTKTSYRSGLDAERKCRWALRLKFYRILAERYKTPAGEIDIIAARGNTVVAVEVKARATQEAAMEAVSTRQQSRIAKALQYFLMRSSKYAKADLRFDVMLSMPGRWPRHIENAWRVD